VAVVAISAQMLTVETITLHLGSLRSL